MKIAKPLLLITTPLGLAMGFYEAYRFSGGLLFLMLMMLLPLTLGLVSVVFIIRREKAQQNPATRSRPMLRVRMPANPDP